MTDTILTPTAMAARPTLHRPGAVREVFETLVLIVAIYALVNLSTVRYFVQGPSMEPTFVGGQFVMVSRLNYLFGSPERGDIIIFNAPGAQDSDPPLIKRVIGLPGETIEFRSQRVYINGVELNEPYIKEACQIGRCQDRTWELGQDQFFFMGDNRNNSRDSRYFGPVSRDRIIGTALIRYWPPSDWAIVAKSRFPQP